VVNEANDDQKETEEDMAPPSITMDKSASVIEAVTTEESAI